MGKFLGMQLPAGSQEKGTVVAAIAGVALVVVALSGRGRSSGSASAGVDAAGLLQAVSAGANAAGSGLGFGAQVATGGLDLAGRVTDTLGRVTTQLGDSLSRVALGQQDLIGRTAAPAGPVVVTQRSPWETYPVIKPIALPSVPAPAPARTYTGFIGTPAAADAAMANARAHPTSAPVGVPLTDTTAKFYADLKAMGAVV